MKIRDSVLPVLRPNGGKEEIAAITEVINSGWWGKGPKVAQFEKEFAAMVGAKYAVAVTSATHGIDLAMKAAGIKDCDVINPTISFLSTAVVPLWNQCTSNIVDVERESLCIDPIDVKRNLKHNTKCVIAVNMAGILANIPEIRNVFDGFIIEDCAHACYAKGAGSRGDVAVWSFQAVKTLACGDGGMITTDNEVLFNKIKSMTWLGITSTYDRVSKVASKPGYTWDYEVDILGYKYYMIDIMAAICLEQMKKLPEYQRQRQEIQSSYNLGLNSLIQPPVWSETVQYYCARAPKEHRDNLMKYLSEKNIHTSVHFKPLHKFAIVKQNRDYPVADTEWLKLISLPCHNAMKKEDVEYVIYWVNKYFEDLPKCME